MIDQFENIKMKIGFSEMYEIGNFDENLNKTDYLGKFVQFSEKYPGYVDIATDSSKIIGVTTPLSTVTSDDPDYWYRKYVFNELGDTYVKNEPIAIGKREYNSILEKSYIRTQKIDVNYVPLVNKDYNPENEYNKRSVRVEWIKVNLLGKVIVYDDGKCNAGDYCKLYSGKDSTKNGTAVKATNKDIANNNINTYYVICRVSPKTIMILFK